MGQKGQPHPQRFGKSAERLAAEDQNRRSDQNAQQATPVDKADDVARHPGEAGYE